MTVEHEVLAVVAERYAELVDRASTAGDEQQLLRAGDKLLDMLPKLPIRAVTAPEGGDAGGGDGGRAGVLQLLDGAPQVGHAANA